MWSESTIVLQCIWWLLENSVLSIWLSSVDIMICDDDTNIAWRKCTGTE